MIDQPVVLPKMVFVTACEMAGSNGPLPAVIGTNWHYWMTEDARTALAAETMDALRDRGFARRDQLHPVWKNTVAVLTGPDREFYAWNSFADGTTAAILVAARGRDAVRVVVGEDVVMLDPVEPEFLATHLLEALPELPGAEVRTVAVPRALMDGTDTASGDTRDAQYLAALMCAPRDAVHQLYTAVRTPAGERERSLPISAIDLTGRGRILTYLTGDDHVELTPGSPHLVVRTLNNTHQQLS
ncbi:ESX secretion-associated protein EspG [Amycolatopsis sp. CA-230715]|uniref:ESX secretion-associated protein EspG n=1 Tax=Amycolatopsis sp. CA-230715 TaxID=2745196 RepID=UPI001C01DB39|nr:ESX secretion-associated protein EspG [Amycolatopsis sp. CA-230715]QWF83723.1 hypothetical protein HUW46_07166 [Amycolatopsis sp. CA-230715]